MILLTNSSSPPSAMISVTPPVFTELGGGRREFLELTPWWGEPQDRQRLGPNPIRELLYYRANTTEPRVLLALAPEWRCGWSQELLLVKRSTGTDLTFASSWLAKKGGLHMQKSYTISVSSFKASISSVFCGTLTTREEIKHIVLVKVLTCNVEIFTSQF